MPYEESRERAVAAMMQGVRVVSAVQSVDSIAAIRLRDDELASFYQRLKRYLGVSLARNAVEQMLDNDQFDVQQTPEGATLRARVVVLTPDALRDLLRHAYAAGYGDQIC